MDATRQAVAGVKASIGYAPQGAERAYVGTAGTRGGGTLRMHVACRLEKGGVAWINKDHRMIIITGKHTARATTRKLKMTEIRLWLYCTFVRLELLKFQGMSSGEDSTRPPRPPGWGTSREPPAHHVERRHTRTSACAEFTGTWIPCKDCAVAVGDTDTLRATQVGEALPHRSGAPERRYLLPKVKVSAGRRHW